MKTLFTLLKPLKPIRQWVVVIAIAAALPNQATAAEPPEFSPQQFNNWRDNFIATNELSAKATAALRQAEFIPRVVELDRKQPEFTLTLNQYLERVINAQRVQKGKQALAANRQLLDKISAKYGVQPRFIVAFWGIETNFGEHTGGFSVISALATLAFDGRRSKYFTKELKNALKIISQGHITNAKMVGSWAGAMGQTQFMPSTFLSYAVDFDGDGKSNVWNSKADALASGANYLSKIGWSDKLTWGREVKLPQGLAASQKVGKKSKMQSLAQWQELGVTSADGSPLPSRNLKAALLIPKRGEGRAFLVYQNFNKILNWNRSNYFAIAVGELSDAILYH